MPRHAGQSTVVPGDAPWPPRTGGAARGRAARRCSTAVAQRGTGRRRNPGPSALPPPLILGRRARRRPPGRPAAPAPLAEAVMSTDETAKPELKRHVMVLLVASHRALNNALDD